ncbi:uncharacterized protein LOC110993434 [Pieris rapae]|uniref:uncharacterized protein LOC110993434 n=1 Tax=Pieris rapae TaxID=64459 RepID=UPI001E27CBB6|nr:uncharacterized protein LOC110993434 [Pieris rapae]XP_022115392.2 uncharacterized protein LOC110993434 [Pieris rapae]
MEPEKPFACTIPDCRMTFTNEDHLHVHTRKHDMVLQLGMEQKAAFAADQTPTPTRFIRNCEEVGLFQDLQNVTVNPFDEGFKRAMEAKHTTLESSKDDVLHTPHLTFPLDGDCTMYTANNQRNITISRSSSDESGAVKEYETTTISKLTNEVTTISRLVKDETKSDKKDHNTVSYTNNVIKIQEIRKDGIVNIEKNDKHSEKNCRKDGIDGKKDRVDAKKDRVDGKKDGPDSHKVPPIMSQQSLDFVVDSLTAENEIENDLEVIVKLPSGKRVKMKSVQENAKEKLRNVIQNKIKPVPLIPCGTLIPVTIKPRTLMPIPRVNSVSDRSVSEVKKPVDVLQEKRMSSSAASKRYRDRVKQRKQREYIELQSEIQRLQDANLKLSAQLNLYDQIIKKHSKKCPAADDLKIVQQEMEKIKQI